MQVKSSLFSLLVSTANG